MPKKGKKGTDQRTKGNVKAASSGRMAELLGGDSGFIGFDVVSSDSVLNGSLSDDIVFGVHSNFQVVLKQMGKRDTTTKLKALNEFVNLCDNEPTDTVVSCLKLWPLMYCKVCMDNDHRVREVTHLALKSCGLAVKKHLGPHIRSIMGCWVSCMCDPILHNAITAQNAFTTVFPPDKQLEVFKFAIKDIVLFVQNLVLKETPDTFTDPKIYPEDERIERYERAVSMAINGLGYTLKQLGEEYLYEEEVTDIWQGVLKESRLWKLSRHKNPLIRSSVYGLVCSLAVSSRYLMTEFKHFCSLVLGGLAEKDAVVIGPLWDAVLYLIDSNKEWSSHVNVQKGVLPGLWSLIEGGGYGNGTRVFPCLLPLLNGLLMVYNDDINFSLNFLQRLRKSLSSDSARISLSDTEAIMNCFKECFFLILKYNIKSAIQLIEIVLELFEYIMSDEITTQYSVLSVGVATIILNVIKLIETENDKMCTELSQYCQEYLIKEISEIITHKENRKLIDRIGDFLTSFHVPCTPSHNTNRHAPSTSFIIPVICRVCSLCLIEATPTKISLSQRLITQYSDNTEQLVSIISKQVRPSQPDDSNQLDQLVSHMITLCDTNEGVEPLLVDSIVSLSCNGNKMDQLVKISKAKTLLAPLILTKVADKGYDIDTIIEEISPIILASDECFRQGLSSPYFVQLLRAMLTESGSQLLKQLSLCQTMVSHLYDVMIAEDYKDCVVEVLSQLDIVIIKQNGDVLTRLLNHLLNQVLNYWSSGNVSIDKLVVCYSHILLHLPNIDSYLSSVNSTIMQRLSTVNTANEVLWVGLCYKCLHCGLLTTFESVYEQFTSVSKAADSEITSTLPPSVFQLFCDGELHYAPPIFSSPVTLCPFVPRSLFPVLLVSVCLVNNQEILQDIGEDRFVTENLLKNKITIFGNEDVLVPALFYMSAISIYSNKDSLINQISQLSIQVLLEALNDMTKLMTYFLKPSRDGLVWSLCLNHLIRSNCMNDILLQSILSNVTDLHIQLVLYKIDNDLLVQEIIKASLEDPCVVAGCLMVVTDKQLIETTALSILSTIIEKHNNKELTILGDDINSCKDPLIFSVLELMIQLVKLHPLTLDSTIWDFIMCQSVSLIQLLTDTYTELSLEGVVMFCRGLILCCEVNLFLSSDSLSSDCSSVSEEWKDFFLPTIQDVLLPCFLKIKGSSQTTDKTILHYYICKAVIELSLLPPPDRWEELIAMIATCRLYSEQVTGFLLALRVLKFMAIKCIGDTTEGTDLSSIQNYIGSFLFNLDLETLFRNHSVTDSEDYYDNYNHTVSYLLLWLLVCEVVGKCDIEARVVMTEWIKEKCQLNLLLHEMFQYCSSVSPQQIKGVSLIPSLSNLCNAVFFSIAQHLPPMLRQWFNTLDKQVSTQVMNFTSKNVTPKLWMNDVKNIHNSKPKATDLEVKVYSSSMEVFVAYRLDDFSIELSVSVPDCYPLLAPAIKEGKRARVDTNLWRKWLLQLNAFVANQNGTLLEGLMVWKSNLDKHFAGLEDCMICFSVIHGSNYSLPKMCCRSCKKKFHSFCLYKWFSTSAKSTCPLCRNVF